LAGLVPALPLRLLAAALLSLTLTASASAGSFRYLPLEELTRRSDRCVVAKVVDAVTGWNDAGNIIVTTFTLQTRETLAGEIAAPLLTLTRVGGELDGMALSYDGMPQLAVGDVATIFLLDRPEDTFIVSGMSQGLLLEVDGRFERDLSLVPDAPTTRQRLDLEQIRGLVQDSLAREPLDAEPRR
jgi:hypothetical protein